MMMKRINDLIPTMKTGNGLFANMTNPVWAEEFTGSTLDIFYAANYGEKFSSKYAELFANDTTGVIDLKLEDLANSLYQLHHKQWERLYADLMVTYDPVDNVTEVIEEEISENLEGEDANTRTLGTTKTTTGSGSTTSTGSGTSESTVTDSNTGSGNDNVFGFDSVNAVGKDTSSSSTSGTSTTEDESSTSATSSMQNTQTEADTGTIRDSGTNGYDKSTSRSYNRHGNIGTVAPASLLSDDVDFWKWNFIKQVCEDIASVISLSVY